jgi:hypothetical protein
LEFVNSVLYGQPAIASARFAGMQVFAHLTVIIDQVNRKTSMHLCLLPHGTHNSIYCPTPVWPTDLLTQEERTKANVEAPKPTESPAAFAQAPEPKMDSSVDKHAGGKQGFSDTTGFLVFDYTVVDTFYGKQAFEAIYEALRSSSGTCTFYAGDISDCELIRGIAKEANLVRSSTPTCPLADLGGPFVFGAYFVGMWTDTYPDFKKVHDALVSGFARSSWNPVSDSLFGG